MLANDIVTILTNEGSMVCDMLESKEKFEVCRVSVPFSLQLSHAIPYRT